MLRALIVSLALVGILASVSWAQEVVPLVRQQIRNLNDWAEALKTGAPQEKLQALEAKVTELDETMAELEIPAQREQRLREQYGAPVQEALLHVGDALTSALIDELNGLADAAEAGAPAERLDALRRKCNAAADKLRKLNLPRRARQKLREKHGKALRAAIRRVLDIEKPQAGT